MNIGAIVNFIDNNENEEKIGYIIDQLTDIEQCDLPIVMQGLLNMEDTKIINQRAIILTKMPESTAGLLNELKTISELY